MFYPAYCIEAGPIPLFPTFAHSLKSKRETIHYDETPEKVPDRAMHAHRSNCIPALHTYTITSSHCTKARKKKTKQNAQPQVQDQRFYLSKPEWRLAIASPMATVKCNAHIYFVYIFGFMIFLWKAMNVCAYHRLNSWWAGDKLALL